MLIPESKVLLVASSARQEIIASFDEENFENIFSRVEVFVAIFPKDEVISSVCVNLLACLLKAIEEGIVFFLSRTRKITLVTLVLH